MKTFNFQNENSKFGKRTLTESRYAIVAAIIATGILTYYSNWLYGIVSGIVFYYVFRFDSLWNNQEYINQISFNQDRLSIIYTNQDQQKTIEGKTKEFSLKIVGISAGFRRKSLVIYHNQTEVIRQYATGEWTVMKMEEIAKLVQEMQAEDQSAVS